MEWYVKFETMVKRSEGKLAKSAAIGFAGMEMCISRAILNCCLRRIL